MNRSGDHKRRTPAYRPILFLLAALWLGACAPTLPPTGRVAAGDHIRARMIAESVEATPGSTLRLAVLFDLDPDWHLYAPYRNDTGLPVLLEPRGPGGVRFGPVGWPAPQRLVSEGAILDHVYDGRVAALLPVELPADARPGSIIRIECRVEWLVCGTGCIPGEGIVSLDIPIVGAGRSPRPSADVPLIRETLDRIPRPASELRSRATETWSADTWTIQLPGARALAFFPAEDCAPLSDVIAGGRSDSERLRLRLAPGSEPGPRLRGTLEVTTLEGIEHYEIDSMSLMQ